MTNKRISFLNLILSAIIAILIIGIVDKFVVNKILSNQISFTVKYKDNDGYLEFCSKSKNAEPTLFERKSVDKNINKEISYSIPFTNSEYLVLNFGSKNSAIEISHIKINDEESMNPEYLKNSIKESTGISNTKFINGEIVLTTEDSTAKLTLVGKNLGLIVYDSVVVDILIFAILTIIIFAITKIIQNNSNDCSNQIKLFEYVFITSFITFILINKSYMFSIDYNTENQLFKFEKIFLALKNNFWIICSCVLAVILTGFIRFLTAKILLAACVGMFIVIYVADYFSFEEFHMHLILSDVLTFVSGSNDSSSIVNHFFSKSSNWVIFSFIISGVVFVYYKLFSKHDINNKFCFKNIYLEIILLLTAIGIQFIPQRVNADDYLSESLIQGNYLSWKSNKNFSHEFLNKLNYKHEIFVNNSRSHDQHKNVILVVIESLTFSKSKYFSHLEDKMPYFDKLAQDNISFMNYYSNGSNSMTGNYSISTNNPFIFNDNSDSFPSYLFENSLARIFKNNGYAARVFSAPRLVYGMEHIYKSSGFDSISNDTDPFYSGKPRYVFNGVSDDVLYNNVIEKLQKEAGNYFYLLNTVTTHAPYLNPITGESSFDSAVEYADKSLDAFVRQLDSLNYFEEGILVIVGDHRGMTPISDREYEMYGHWCNARMPLVIIDKDIKGLSINDHLSHNSLGSIIQYLSLPQVVMSKEQGNPFLHKTELVLFNQYNRRNEVFVRHGDDYESTLYLSGDDSYLSKSTGQSSKDDEIIGYAAWLKERISCDK